MNALVFDGSLRFVADYPTPRPEPGDALVRVRLAGICNTDLEITRGYKGFHGVLGHEFVGTVEAAEDTAWVGRRVVGEINITCGECAYCTGGMPTHCTRRKALGIFGHDGAFAEYLTLPVRNLHPVPDTLSDEEAVFTEPLAAALEVLEMVDIRPADHVAVVGDGKLGLLVAQVMHLVGAHVTVVGRHEERLAWMARLGMSTHHIPRGAPSTLPTIPSPFGKADVVVDCTGSPQGFATARALVRSRGTLVMKSTYHGRLEVDMTSLVVDEVRVVGTRCGPFEPALRLLAEGRVEVLPLIETTYPLAEGPAAFEHARGRLKVLLRP